MCWFSQFKVTCLGAFYVNSYDFSRRRKTILLVFARLIIGKVQSIDTIAIKTNLRTNLSNNRWTRIHFRRRCLQWRWSRKNRRTFVGSRWRLCEIEFVFDLVERKICLKMNFCFYPNFVLRNFIPSTKMTKTYDT